MFLLLVCRLLLCLCPQICAVRWWYTWAEWLQMAWHVCLENRQNNLHLLMMYFITLLYRSIAAFWSSSLVSFFSAFLIIIDITIMIIGLINDQHHNNDHFYWIDHLRQNLSPPSWPTFHFQALLPQKNFYHKKLLPQQKIFTTKKLLPQQQKITPKKLLPQKTFTTENFYHLQQRTLKKAFGLGIKLKGGGTVDPSSK